MSRLFSKGWQLAEAVVLAVATLPLVCDIGMSNKCSGATAVLSPSHRLSALVLWFLSLLAFVYSTYRKRIISPVIEVLVNCCLLMGLPLIFFWCVQSGYLLVIWVPLTLMFLLALVENHTLALEEVSGQENVDKGLLKLCRKIISLPAFVKFPLLVILCLPVLLVCVSILLLFGQQPDSMVRAFTDTYKHGFSQLNDQCNYVAADFHFLCTVAAKGHSDFVKPLRSGIRDGQRIKCNRQLLVANAFEELLEQRLPRLHRPIRALYNKVGDFIHRYYGVFNNKWVADLVYVLMKPLEWLFVLVLYVADRKPENRIAQQYMDWNDRKKLKESLLLVKKSPVRPFHAAALSQTFPPSAAPHPQSAAAHTAAHTAPHPSPPRRRPWHEIFRK